MAYEDLEFGQTYEFTRTITADDVRAFAELSGDFNPVHFDAEFAATTIFKKPVVHGMLVGALISKALASDLPGPGTVYLKQELKFLKPVFHDDEIRIALKIVDLNHAKKLATIDTQAWVGEKQVVAGSALVTVM